jgi:polyferredoxin
VRNTSLVKWDILSWKPVRVIVMTGAFPVVFQGLTLCLVLWLALSGLGIGTGLTGDTEPLRQANLTTLTVWGIWLPAVVLTALLLGRVWCTVCPLELVNRAGCFLADVVRLPRARLNGFLRAGWVTVLLYLLLFTLVAGLDELVPHNTSILLFTLTGCAFVAGIVFSDYRAFCTAFCPQAALLSVYGSFAPVQLETRSKEICGACLTKDCGSEANRKRFDRRSCPSMIRPYARDPSDGCVLCFQCAKVCPNRNIGFGKVSSNAPVKKWTLLLPFEAVFVMMVLGWFTKEIGGEVPWINAIIRDAPVAFLNRLAPSISPGWFTALWFVVLFPLTAWGSIALIGFLLGHRSGIRQLLLAIATGIAPIAAVAHLTKAVAKMSSWGGFIPIALKEPHGLKTMERLADHAISPPPVLLGMTLPVIGWIVLPLLLIVFVKAWPVGMDTNRGVRATARRAGLAASFLLFSALLTAWVWPR